MIKWPGPLLNLIPFGGGIDEINGQALMEAIARGSAQDLEGALRRARDASAPYISDARTTMEAARFRPVWVKEGEDGLLGELYSAATGDSPFVRTLKEAMEMPAWEEIMSKPVSIRRAWGPLGLFWSLLIDRLESERSFRVCELCGRVISGIRLKRFCGRDDNPECFRQRRAKDKREERRRLQEG
jgi:hypothetical protein